MFAVTEDLVIAGGGRFCTCACQAAWQGRNKVVLTCGTCDATFKRSPSRAPRSGKAFCSLSCRDQSPERVAQLREMNAAQSRSKAPTRPERALYALLSELLPAKAWEQQYLFAGKLLLDAAVPGCNLAIQADGDYWHGKGKQLDEVEPRVRRRMQFDRSQDAYLEAAGWSVVRLWESDLADNPDLCRTKLRSALFRQDSAASRRTVLPEKRHLRIGPVVVEN